MKKTYITPSMKVREIESGVLMGSTDMNNEVGTDGQKAKGNFVFSDDAVNSSSAVSSDKYNIWASENE